jgi:hypothetical protein
MTKAECVEAGMARLDADRPGWWRDLDEHSLDMRSGRDDVLGRVYGSFFAGLRALGLFDGSDACGVRFGFIHAQAWDEARGVARSSAGDLARAWACAIGERRRMKGAA